MSPRVKAAARTVPFVAAVLATLSAVVCLFLAIPAGGSVQANLLTYGIVAGLFGPVFTAMALDCTRWNDHNGTTGVFEQWQSGGRRKVITRAEGGEVLVLTSGGGSKRRVHGRYSPDDVEAIIECKARAEAEHRNVRDRERDAARLARTLNR